MKAKGIPDSQIDDFLYKATGKVDDLADLLGVDNLYEIYPKTYSRIPDKSFSTGRKTWNNLDEQIAMQEVFSNPLKGATPIKNLSSLSDNKLPGNPADWGKYRQHIYGIEIHFNYNSKTGEFLDFKFKN